MARDEMPDGLTEQEQMLWRCASDDQIRSAFDISWPHENVKDALRAIAIMRKALQRARTTIKFWHGEVAWPEYQYSPEMQAINSALAKAEGE